MLDKMGRLHKALLLHAKCGHHLKEKHLYAIGAVTRWANHPVFVEQNHSLKKLANSAWLLRHVFSRRFSLKRNK